MDMIMVSLGENEGKQGEEVVIYGKQQGAEISVDEIYDVYTYNTGADILMILPSLK